MFSADCWAPKFESEVPDWKKYQYIPSDFDEVICCLAMNMEPEVGLHLLSQQDSIENEKQYKHYVVYGDHQPDGSVDTDKDSFRIKELAFCIESANQLGFLDLPAQSLDLGDNFKVMEYMDGYIGEFIGEFKGAFYREYLEKGSLGGLPPVTEELKDGLHYLACSMNDKAFIKNYKKLFRIIKENKTENGGTLKYVEGSSRIRFIDFVEWSGRVGLMLPFGFPSNTRDEFVIRTLKPSTEVKENIRLDLKNSDIPRVQAEKEPEPMSGHPETQIEWILYILTVEEKLKPGMLPRRGLQSEIVSRAAGLKYPIGESTIKRAWKKAFYRFSNDTN